MHRGFTLIEVLVAMAIAALALAVAVPQVRGTVDAVRVRTAAATLANELRAARAQAMRALEETVLRVDVDARSYRVGDRQQSLAVPSTTAIAITAARSEQESDVGGAIRFFPDGSSTGGRIMIGREPRPSYRIDVHWLTGKVTLTSGHEDPG